MQRPAKFAPGSSGCVRAEDQGAFADVIAYPCLRLLSCHFNLKTQMVGSLPTPLAVEDLFSGFRSSGRLSEVSLHEFSSQTEHGFVSLSNSVDHGLACHCTRARIDPAE